MFSILDPFKFNDKSNFRTYLLNAIIDLFIGISGISINTIIFSIGRGR